MSNKLVLLRLLEAFGAYLVAEGIVEEGAPAEAMHRLRVRESLEAADVPLLLDYLVAAGALQPRMRGELCERLVSIVPRGLAAMSDGRADGLAPEERCLRAAYQQGLLGERQVVELLWDLQTRPDRSLVEALRASGWLTDAQLAGLEQTLAPPAPAPKVERQPEPRGKTKRSAAPGRQPQPPRKETTRRERQQTRTGRRPAPAKNKRKNNTGLIVGLSCGAVAVLCAVALALSGGNDSSPQPAQQQPAPRRQARVEPRPDSPKLPEQRPAPPNKTEPESPPERRQPEPVRKEPEPQPPPRREEPRAEMTREERIQASNRSLELADKAMKRDALYTALQHANEALRLVPENPEALYLKAGVHLFLGNGKQGLEAIGRAIELATRSGQVQRRAMFRTTQGQLYTLLVEPEKAHEAYRAAERDDRNNGFVHYLRGVLLLRQGRPPERALRLLDRSIKMSGGKHGNARALRGVALEKLGRYREALAEYESLLANPPQPRNKEMALAQIAWLHFTAGGRDGLRVEKAHEMFRQLARRHYLAWTTKLVGRYLSRTGRHLPALEAFDKHGQMQQEPEGLLDVGRTLLELGYLDRARKMLLALCRWCPQAREQVLQLPGISQIAAAFQRDLTDYSAKTVGEKIEVAEDQASMGRAIAWVDGLVLAGRFHQALEDYRAFRPWVQAGSIGERLDERIGRATGYVKLLDRLIAAINGRNLSRPIVEIGSLSARIVAADREGMQLVFRGGKASWRWVALGLPLLSGLLEQLALSAEDRLQLGTLAWLHGERERAMAHFAGCEKEVALKRRLDRFVALQLGRAVPAGGFVRFGGRYVTPREKQQLQAGRVQHEGRWVARAERDKLEQGYRQRGGQWVKLSPQELRRAGYALHRGKWVRLGDLDRLRGDWADVKQLQTEHYILRSDRGEQFLARLGQVAESLHGQLARSLGAAPAGEGRMIVLAFKELAAYRAYLAQAGRDKQRVLRAPGRILSKPLTCSAYDRYQDTDSFLQSLAHQAVRLYLRLAGKRPVAPWLERGLACYWEGFRARGEKIEWGVVPRDRLLFLRRAMARGKLLPLEELLQMTPRRFGELGIQQTLSFEAQAWGLVYFLQHSVDTPLREGFARYLQQALRGQPPELLAALGAGLAALESGYLQFLRDL